MSNRNTAGQAGIYARGDRKDLAGAGNDQRTENQPALAVGSVKVKEYKEWVARRKRECFDLLTRFGESERIVGRAVAFEECFNKCPDFFEMDAEKPGKEAESKIQSMTDKMENLKKQLKESKERADNGWERVRYLERKLRDVESLNDQLLRELARRQCKEETGE